MLTILPYFKSEEILVVMNEKSSLGKNKFKNKLYRTTTFKNYNKLFETIKKFSPDIVINDILDTKAGFVKRLRKMNCFVINFEDLGSGSEWANLVFNPIYYQKSTKTKFFGEKYACVRDEFRKKKLKTKQESVLITFGGVDPKKLTLRLLRILHRYKPQYKILVIIGDDFSHANQIISEIDRMRRDKIRVEKIIGATHLSKFVDNSMFAVTANGRTVFEVASRCVPVITISANIREERHEFPKKKNVGYHVGLHSEVSDETLLRAIKNMESAEKRATFVKEMKKMKLGDSVLTVKNIINERFLKWESNKDV